mmetsp:Transcript_5213/g.14742  ORF Transcript_5213/g.14742 Transcript_5213/m.14742 type:complete len:226 (-) Transcript_5213:7-684(-)
MIRQPTPSTTNVHRFVSWLHSQCVRDEVEFLQLCIPHRLVRPSVDRARVHHGLTESSFKPIVSLVVSLWKITGVLRCIMEPRTGQPSSQIPLQLDFAEHWRIYFPFKNCMEVAIACLDICFQSLSQRRLRHVITILLRNVVRFIQNETAQSQQNQWWGNNHKLPQRRSYYENQPCNNTNNVREAFCNKYDKLEYRKHHLDHHPESSTADSSQWWDTCADHSNKNP